VVKGKNKRCKVDNEITALEWLIKKTLIQNGYNNATAFIRAAIRENFSQIN